MATKEICQSIYQFNFYDDLDVLSDGLIGVDPDGNMESITLTINGKEILIEGEAAESIYEALEVRIKNKITGINKAEQQAYAIQDYEISKRDEYEMRIMEKGA